MKGVSLPLAPKDQLQRRYDEHVDSLEKLIDELARRVRAMIVGVDVRATVKYRVKSFDSYFRKLIRLSRLPGADRQQVVLTDLIGLRVVCPFLEDVTEAERALHGAFVIREVDRKGSAFSVREFGYDSIHCLLEVPQDLLESFDLDGPLDCEVQLRTILQDAWAEVEHELVYKSEFTPFDEQLQRKLAALNANLSLSDITFQEIREYQRRLTHELRQRRTTFWDTLCEATGDSRLHELSDGHDAEAVTFGVSADLARKEGVDSARRSETPANLDAQLLAALQAHNAGDHQRAVTIYTVIIDASPIPFVRAVVHIHRGMARFASGSYRKALDDFSAALEIDAQNSRALFYRGIVFRILGDVDRAEQDFTRCLALDPYRVDCLYQFAALHLSQGRLDDAHAACERALEIEPGSETLQQLRRSIHERRAYEEQ